GGEAVKAARGRQGRGAIVEYSRGGCGTASGKFRNAGAPGRSRRTAKCAPEPACYLREQGGGSRRSPLASRSCPLRFSEPLSSATPRRLALACVSANTVFHPQRVPPEARSIKSAFHHVRARSRRVR